MTPTIEREFLRIRNEAHRASHVSWTSVHFGVRPLTDAVRAGQRTADLAPLHGDLDDRMVLAEAEDIGFTTLLSFDPDFVKHLGAHARLLLTRPAPYWESLGVPKRTTPNKVPAFGNPLAHEEWCGGEHPTP